MNFRIFDRIRTIDWWYGWQRVNTPSLTNSYFYSQNWFLIVFNRIFPSQDREISPMIFLLRLMPIFFRWILHWLEWLGPYRYVQVGRWNCYIIYKLENWLSQRWRRCGNEDVWWKFRLREMADGEPTRCSAIYLRMPRWLLFLTMIPACCLITSLSLKTKELEFWGFVLR